MLAAAHGHHTTVQLLLKAHPDLNNARDREGKSALMIAASKGYAVLVAILLTAPGTNPHEHDIYQTTVLIWAIRGANDTSSEQVIKMLLDIPNTDINAVDNVGCNALNHAARMNKLKTLRLLLANGADPFSLDFKHNTALQYAINRGFHEIAVELNAAELELFIDSVITHAVERVLSCVRYRPVLFNQALLYGSFHGDMVLIQSLLVILPEGDLNGQDDDGNTALMMASRTGHADIVQLFLSMPLKIALNLQNKFGNTALILAAYSNHIDIVQSLLQAGADRTLRDHKHNLTALGFVQETAAANLNNQNIDALLRTLLLKF
jgi:serine/threonine-protein phosphatase 6 regulatory ankyrin repeat subunit B